MKANLTLVIGAATNSSRAADNETGDVIQQMVTGVESGVTDAVVLLHKAQGKEFAFDRISEQLNKQL